MVTTHKKRPDGDAPSWDWKNAERILAVSTDIISAKTAACVFVIRASTLTQDLRIDKLVVSLANSPGVGDTVVVTVSNGSSTMTVTMLEGDPFGASVENAFDLDVSEQDLTVLLTVTDGKEIGCCTILLIYHDITITA